MITESIVTTLGSDGTPHIAPMGVIWEAGHPVLAPFRPSTTLSNIETRHSAVINFTDDVRIFAGCLTGRRSWPTLAADKIDGVRLETALTHLEMVVERQDGDAQRPRFHGRVIHEGVHRPFRGFNRAQAAVIEASILVSRLSMLPREKIEHEFAYLRIAIGKTAGAQEAEAWDWVSSAIEAHLSGTGAVP